jgi:hypothetical protein
VPTASVAAWRPGKHPASEAYLAHPEEGGSSVTALAFAPHCIVAAAGAAAEAAEGSQRPSMGDDGGVGGGAGAAALGGSVAQAGVLRHVLVSGAFSSSIKVYELWGAPLGGGGQVLSAATGVANPFVPADA